MNWSGSSDQFTVCSSVYNTHFVTSHAFFQLMQEDGSSWFSYVHLDMKLEPETNPYQRFQPTMFLEKTYYLLGEFFTAG